METVHVYCGCCVALTSRIRDGKRRPQLKSHTWSVQVTCLVVGEGSVRASGCRAKLIGVMGCKRSKGEGIGIKYGWSKSPLVRLPKAGLLVFICVLIAELSAALIHCLVH